MDFIRDRAMEGTMLAHFEGGVPNLIVEADGKTPERRRKFQHGN